MKIRDVSLGNKILLGFLPPIALVLVLMFVVGQNQAMRSDAADWVRHTHEAIGEALALEKLVLDMETGQRGYVITGVPVFLEPYDTARLAWNKKAIELKELVGDNPSQVRRVDRIIQLEERWLAEAGQRAIDARDSSFEEARDLVLAQTGKSIVDAIRVEIDAFIAAEEALLWKRQRDVREANAQVRAVTIFGVALFAAAILVLAFRVRRWALEGIEPLMQLTESVTAGGSLEKIPVARGVEFGALSESFNTMIEAVKREQKRALHVGKLASIGQLAAGVGHEINNPLAAAMGNVELAGRELAKPAPDLDRLRSMNEKELTALLRVARIVDGLRTHARIDEEIKMLDVHDAIASTESLIGDLYRRDNVEIRIRPDAARSSIKGSDGRIQQVLMNLIANAKDAMEGSPGGVIRIETRNDRDDLVVEVSDDGTGIPEDLQARIFDAFFTTKKVGEGTGMGLSIAAQIVQDTGGRIDVSSKVGEGTTFTLRFPTVSTAAPEEPWGDPEAETVEWSGRYHGRALVVDDEDGVRSVLRHYLEDLGFQVDEARNAREGLDRMTACHYEYVFTDMKMPDFSGDQLIEKARQLVNGDTRYFLVTGGVDIDASSERWSRIRDITDGFLTKPFTLRAIVDALSGRKTVADIKAPFAPTAF